MSEVRAAVKTRKSLFTEANVQKKQCCFMLARFNTKLENFRFCAVKSKNETTVFFRLASRPGEAIYQVVAAKFKVNGQKRV